MVDGAYNANYVIITTYDINVHSKVAFSYKKQEARQMQRLRDMRAVGRTDYSRRSAKLHLFHSGHSGPDQVRDADP